MQLVGFIAMTIASTLYACSILLLKRFSVGFIFQISIYLMAFFVPGVFIVSYYNNYTDKKFNMKELFTNKLRLVIALCNTLYVVCAFAAFKILPISYAFPLFYTYPLFIICFSHFIDNSPLITTTETYGFSVVALGLLMMIVNGYMENQQSNGFITGTVLVLLGSLFVSLLFTFSKNVKHRNLLTISSEEIDASTKDKPESLLLAEEILTCSTLPLIFISSLAIIYILLPNKTIENIKNVTGLPSALLGRSYGQPNELTTLSLLFITYVIFSAGGTTAGFLANNFLPSNLFSPLTYLYVLVGSFIGYLFLGESLSPLKLFGLLFVFLGAGFNILYNERMKKTHTKKVHIRSPLPSTMMKQS